MERFDYDLVNAGITGAIYGPSGQEQARMAFEGVRYGDPDLPRYATGRRDGRAPELDTRTDFTLETRRIGGREVANADPVNRRKVQPKRSSHGQ